MTWITWTLWIYPLTMRPSKMTSCDVNLKSLLVYLDHKCNALRLYNKTGLKSTEPPWHVGPLLIGHQRLAPMAVVAVPLAPDQYLQAKQDRSRTEKYQNIWKICAAHNRKKDYNDYNQSKRSHMLLPTAWTFSVEAYLWISCYPCFPNIQLALWFSCSFICRSECSLSKKWTSERKPAWPVTTL